MARLETDLFPAGPPVGPGGVSAARRVYDDLWRRIVALELLPDTTLSRAELAQHYGLSQTPIREAMQELERDGLVRIYPQSRTVVARIDSGLLEQNQFLRVSLECEVVRRLVERRETAGIARARSIARMQMAVAGDLSQARMFDEMDRALHRALFEGVGMLPLHALVARRQGHLARCQRLELPKAGRMEQIVADHDAVLCALEAGDADGAVAAMRKHLSGTIQRIAALQAEFPAYFSES